MSLNSSFSFYTARRINENSVELLFILNVYLIIIPITCTKCNDSIKITSKNHIPKIEEVIKNQIDKDEIFEMYFKNQDQIAV